MKQCLERNIPIISSMGAANKMDPTRFRIADISKRIQIRLRKSFVQNYEKKELKRYYGCFFR